MILESSNMPQTVNNVFLIILITCIILLVLITFLMIFFVIKYNRKKNTKPVDIEGNTFLEILWTVIPTILVLGMFYFGWVGYKMMKDVPKDAMEINVIGRMWAWLFDYGNGVQSDTLYVPLNKPIKLNLTSRDVIHSFFVPAFRVKQDVVPGLEKNHMWFKPEKLGSYDVLCAEYCGQQHAYMLSKVVVMLEHDFTAWIKSKTDTLIENDSLEKEIITPVEIKESPEKSNQSEGMILLAEKGCTACHSTDGSSMAGSTFKGLYGKKRIVISNGKEQEVIANEDYLRKSILEPNAEIVKGYAPIMPSQKRMSSEKEISEMIVFIKGLK